MGKDLSEMTLEELWELFPIFLVAHDDRWKDCYRIREWIGRWLMKAWKTGEIWNDISVYI